MSDRDDERDAKRDDARDKRDAVRDSARGETQGIQSAMDLTPNTKVSLVWLIGGMIFVASFTIAHFSTLWSIKSDISTMRRSIEFIDSDYWSKTQQEIFALKLRLMNSNILIPDVNEMRRKSL